MMSMASLTIIIILLVAIGLIVFTLISRNNLLKSLTEIEGRKKETSARNISEHLGKVKQLNLTGETEALFEKWRNNWDEIIETSLPGIDESLVAIEQSINKYAFSKAKDQLQLVENMINTVNERIDSILLEVDGLIESKKESAAEMEKVTSQYRNMKKNVLAHRHSFSLCEKKLEEQLDAVKMKITSFDEATTQGNYLFAKGICEETKKLVDELQEIINEIPSLQVEMQTNIPKQLENIANGYKQMEESGYVLQHLQLEEELAELFEAVETSVEVLKELEVEDAQLGVSYIQKRVDEIYDQLEEEVKAKHIFDKEIGFVQEELNHFQARTIATKEETKLVKRSYELHDKDIEVQKNIENQLAILQGRYETIQLQVAEQDIAFSVMREDLQEIRQQLEEMDVLYSEYVEKIHALRKDELDVRDKLQEMKRKMLDVRRLLKNSNIPGLPSDYNKFFEQSQVTMQMVYKELEKKPLDMELVNRVLQQATEAVDTTVQEVHHLIEQAHMAEKMIQYGNRYRSRSKKSAKSLQEAEGHFRNFKYDKAIEEVSVTIEENDPGAVEKLKEMVRFS